MFDPIIISHRGNLTGSLPTGMENSEQFIVAALELGFDVEVDLWCFKPRDFSLIAKSNAHHWDMYLGHNGPKHETTEEFLGKNAKHLWIHCKNREALNCSVLKRSMGINFFWHENDRFTITSHGNLWCHCDASKFGTFPYNSVGLWLNEPPYEEKLSLYENCSYICTDHPTELKSLIASQKRNE